MKKGLDTDLFDERSESLGGYRQRGELIADFFRDIENRFLSIEYKLSRFERKRCGHQ